MKPIERAELLGLAEYEQVRDRFRSRVIGEKKVRRVQLGPKATAVFENRDTVLLQIQEMLRTERITRPAAVQHEVDTYNDSVPGDDQLSCTVMIEIIDKDEREAFLRDARGFEAQVWLVVGADRIRARSIDRGVAKDRTTAVHYLKFDLPAPTAAALRNASTARSLASSLEVDHPAYAATAPLSPECVEALRDDLSP